MPGRKITAGDFMTTKMVRDAVAIYRTAPLHLRHRRLLHEVIKPNMAEINRKLGQENNPEYFAYLVEYLISNAEEKNRASQQD